MSKTHCHKTSSLFSKWLFAVVLLLSFLAFTGTVTRSQPKIKSTETTLTVNSLNNQSRSISYKRALIKDKVIPALLFVDLRDVSLLHTQQAKDEFTDLSVIYADRRHHQTFHQQKTIPQNSDEAPASLIG